MVRLSASRVDERIVGAELCAWTHPRILDTVHTIFVSHAVYTYAMGAAKFVTASDKPVWFVP